MPGRYALCLTAKPMRDALIWIQLLLSRPVAIYLRSFVVVALAATLHASEPLRLLMTGTGLDLGPGSVRGVASDGTNFITATRAPDGHIRRLLMTPADQTSWFDSGKATSPPLFAFGSVNYLMVWVDSTNVPSAIYGQFINPSGSEAGTAFIIRSNANAQ